MADEYRGEVIHAFAALAPGTSASEEDVIEYCAQNLAKYKVPEKIYFIETLPKTPANKIDKQAIHRLVQAKA